MFHVEKSNSTNLMPKLMHEFEEKGALKVEEKIWKNILIIAIQERFHPINHIFKEVISFSI